ncbi:hypothetical protein DPSP01_013292 [Paraphaeosphaeria sporulosa]
MLEVATYFRNYDKDTMKHMDKLPKIKGDQSRCWRHLLDMEKHSSMLFLFVLLCTPKLDFLPVAVVNHSHATLRDGDHWYNLWVRGCLEMYCKASDVRLEEVQMWFKEITETPHQMNVKRGCPKN